EPSGWPTVIQVPPGEGFSHSHPSPAALLRRPPLDSQQEPGGWVPALPAVPVPVADEIWRTLGAFARRRWTPNRRSLVSCVGEIKGKIIEAGIGQPAGTPPDQRIVHHVAQDVLLVGPWLAAGPGVVLTLPSAGRRPSFGPTCGRDTPFKGVSRPQVPVRRAVDTTGPGQGLGRRPTVEPPGLSGRSGEDALAGGE